MKNYPCHMSQVIYNITSAIELQITYTSNQHMSYISSPAKSDLQAPKIHYLTTDSSDNALVPTMQ